jgi:hypothetical protein
MYPFGRLVVLGFSACLVATAAPQVETNAFYQAPGTKRMAERLQQWHREFGDRQPLENRAKLKQLQQDLPQTRDVMQRITIQYEIANEQLNLGQPEAALTTFTNLHRDAREARVRLSPNDRRDMRLLEGLAYLRLGEVENCVHHHNPDSCLLPIRGSGQHTKRRGAESAEAIFLELARQKTNDLGARWLLNIASMTLGKYPAGVPEALRIPPSIFESETAFPKFPEMGTALGLGENMLAGGTITDDFDGDGLLDVFVSSWGPLDQCALYRNLGNGKFEDIARKAGLEGVTGGLNIMQTDYNNDGWLDVYIVRGAWIGEMGLIPDSLLRNNGDGTFADVTEEAGLLSMHPALSAVWFDANNDGWIDLFIGNETRTLEFPHPCQLFLNQRDGTFRESAQQAGVGVSHFVRGVSAGDFDNDGWTDLYVSCLNEKNILFRNDARTDETHFTDVTSQFGVGEPLMSFPTWFWDYNNDGWLDIWVSGYGDAAKGWYSSVAFHVTLGELVADKLGLPNKADTFRLYRNERGKFADVTREAKLDDAVLAMSANFGDLDNDGFLDFYTGTGAPSYGSLVPNEMYRNDRGVTFQNVTTAGGFGHLQKGHAIAFADLNNDGAEEVMLNVGGAYFGDTFYDALFVNPGTTNNWVTLKLVGQKSNRGAIGARIKVMASHKGETREIHRVVGSGGSFGSSPLQQHIGLGQCEKIERVELWWPVSGQTNILTSLHPNRFYEITEGQTQARALERKRFAWPGPERHDSDSAF